MQYGNISLQLWDTKTVQHNEFISAAKRSLKNSFGLLDAKYWNVNAAFESFCLHSKDRDYGKVEMGDYF